MSDFSEVLSSPLWPALKSGILENPGSLPQLISLMKAVDPLLGAKIDKDTAGFMNMIQATVQGIASMKSSETEDEEHAQGQGADANDWTADLWESVESDSCFLSDSQQLGLEPHLFEFDDL